MAMLRTRTTLVLEAIALRHQIGVLKRNRTRRPCFRRLGRLLWILLSRWWRGWRDSLVIVQPETVLRWRRDGWSAMWGYRSRGRWRGGRPRVHSEIRHLIARMASENFLWGAPRIHGELLKLGFTVSQATVSRYLPAPGRRPTQSWRTFFRNQTMAFSDNQYSEQQPDTEYPYLHAWSYWGRLVRFAAAQLAMVCASLCRWLGQLFTLNALTIDLRSAQRDQGAIHRARRMAAVPGCSWKAHGNRYQAAARSPPSQARASPRLRPRTTQASRWRIVRRI